MTKKYIIKKLSLFYLIGSAYVFVEMCYRGFSHISMFFLAGFCGLFIDSLNNYFSFDMDILLQAVISALFCALFEGITGLIVNVWLKLDVWDYSNLTSPTFMHGQVSLPFVFIWFALSFLAILGSDSWNYYIFHDGRAPYYKLFGKVILKMPKYKINQACESDI